MLNVNWISGLDKGRLIVTPRPQGGQWLQAEVQRWGKMGVNVVASMLSREEVMSFGLAREADLCTILGMNFLSFPIEDHSVPQSKKATREFAQHLSLLLEQDKSVLVHCFAGMGRSVLMAACVLILRGMDPEDACEAISLARGISGLPETREQREWIMEFAEDLK